MEKLFKDYELVEYLGGAISLSKVRHFRLVGGFVPFVKIGAAVRYRKSDVDAYLNGLQGFQNTSEALDGVDMALLTVGKLEFGCVRKEQDFTESIQEAVDPFASVRDKVDMSRMVKEVTEPPKAFRDEMSIRSMAKEATEPPVYKGGKNDKR